MQQTLHRGHRADQSQQRCQYLLALLIVGFWVGLLDWRLSLFGLLVLCTLSPLVVDSSRFDITIAAQSGKYIPGEVTKDADALQDLRHRPVLTLEQGSDQPLAMVPRQQYASQLLLPKPRATPDRGSGSKKQLAMILRPRSAVNKVQTPTDVAVLGILPRVELAPSSFSINPLLIEESSSNSLPVPLVRFLSTRNASSISTLSLYQTHFGSAGPCQVEPLPLPHATTPSPVVSPSSEDSTLVLRMEQENQAAAAAGETLLKKMRQDQHTPSAGDQSVEEPINGQKSVEVENDSVGQPEDQSIEEPTDGQASVENENALETDSETIENSIDGQTSVGREDDSPLQVGPQVIDTPTDDHVSMEAISDEAIQAEPETIESPTDGHTSRGAKDDEAFQIEPETIETPADCQLSPNAIDEKDLRVDHGMIPEPFSHHIFDEQKNVRVPKLDSGPIGLVADSQPLNEEEDEKGDFNVPRTGSDVVLDRTLEAQNLNELGDSQSPLSIAVRNRRTASKEDVGSSRKLTNDVQTHITGRPSPPASINRNRVTAQNSKAQRLVKSRVARFRIRNLERPHADRVGTLRLKVTEERASLLRSFMNRHSVAVSAVEDEDSMVGLEVQEQVMHGTEDGESTNPVTRTDATVDGVVELDQVMSDFKVEESSGDGDIELVDADSTEQEIIDEVMIGSDVEAEMEVDDETYRSDADSGPVVGEPMDLKEDVPPLEANQAGHRSSVKLREDGLQSVVHQANNLDSMDVEYPSQHVMVNKETLQDRIRREKAVLALRQTSTKEAGSGEIASGSISASAQSSQQHAAPVSRLEPRDTAISIPQGVAPKLKFTNTASELREARLGKRAESRTVPAEVAVPSALSGVPAIEDGDTSDTTQPTMTATSTPPTSTSSTPPASPLPRVTMTSESSPTGSAKGNVAVPKKKDCKRGCDSLDASNDDEELVGRPEKANVNQSGPSTPGPGSSNVSATRRVLRAKTVKRKVPTKSDAGSSSASQPTTISPAESSKRVRQKRPSDAESDKEIAPLKDTATPMTGKCESWKRNFLPPFLVIFGHNTTAFCILFRSLTVLPYLVVHLEY